MTLSLNFRRAAYAAETGRVVIPLITITHDDLSDPIRISGDPTERLSTPVNDIVYGTVSRGNNYIYLPARLVFSSDTPSGPGEMTIEIDNIHRAYTEFLRSISSPASFLVELVLDDDRDTVEREWPEFLLTLVNYDIMTIRGTLSLETLTREAFPSGSFSPTCFPGLFR